MNNPEVLKIINNLRGRKNYEEKKASKLSFNSLYSYIEDKILNEKKAAVAEIKKTSEKLEDMLEDEKSERKKSCYCC